MTLDESLNPNRRLRLHLVRALLMAALAVGLIGTGIALGNWQLRRAAQKEQLQAQLDAQGRLPAMPGAELLDLPAEQAQQQMHRPVTLRGLWLQPRTVYLDNRQMHGRPGFYVLTPLALEGRQETVMVQRGWIPRNFNDREQLAVVETPPGLVEVQGLMSPPPAHLLSLGEDASRPAAPADAVPAAKPATSSDAPAPVQPTPASPSESPNGITAAVKPPAPPGPSPIRQNLDLKAFAQETGLPLRTDFTLRETGAASQGLERDWPAPALGVDKHYGYAFQWFGLAGLVAILYVWFEFIAPRRRRARDLR